MNREDCNRWLRRQIQEGTKRLILSTVPSELRKGSEELLAIRITKKPDDKWYKATVRAVEDAVKRDMETLDHPSQAYALIANDKDGELMDRFPFREIDPDGSAPVESTPDGLLTQLMHHNRDMAKTMADMTKSLTTYYERTLGQLTDSHAKLIDERLSTIDVVERLRSEEFERRLTLKREESSDEMRSQLLTKLMALAPVVVSKLTGHVMPGTKSDGDHLILSLMETLQPEQLERLMSILSPEQQVLILTLIENYKRREESKESKPSPVQVVK